VHEFDSDPKSIDIDAAIAAWVVDVESSRARHFRRKILSVAAGLTFVLIALFFFGVYAYHMPVLRSYFLSRFLAYHDPAVFNNSADGNYEIARALDSYGALLKETRLSDEILGTQQSFDMLVNNAQYIRHAQKENFLRLVGTGRTVRIILWDYRESNRPNYDAFCLAIGQNPEETREGAKNVHSELREWKRTIESDKARYPGQLEFRWNKKPLLYTMWLRDWGTPVAMGHLSVNFYRGQEYFPSFRVSMRDGSRLLENMHDEFEHAWRDSEDLDAR
jgi:hypothetical protein